MFEAIQTFFVDNAYTLELTAAVGVFAFYFPRRKLFWLRLLASYAALLGFSVLINFLMPETSVLKSSIKYIFMLVIAGGGAMFCLKISVWGMLFCIVGGSATQHIAFRIVSGILSVCGFPYASMQAFFIDIAVVVAVYLVAFFIFAGRIKSRPEKYLESKYNILLALVFILFSTVLQFIAEEFVSMEDSPGLYVLISVYDLICSVFTLCMQYGLFRNSVLSNDVAVMEHLMHKQEEQYRVSKDTIDMINIKCHDLKHQISRLSGRVDPEELGAIKSAVTIYDTAFKTGNEVLDVFLAEKSLIFKKYDIKLDCMADGAALSFMSPPDIYSLFGNALDNAFDALVRIEDTSKRLVTVTVRQKLGMVIIHFENSYQGELNFDGELPGTTKEDKRYHGFGMRSIKMVVEKYRGNLSVRTEKGIFNLNVLIPVQKARHRQAGAE